MKKNGHRMRHRLNVMTEVDPQRSVGREVMGKNIQHLGSATKSQH